MLRHLSRSIYTSALRRAAHGHVAHPKSTESLAEALQKRIPAVTASSIGTRLDQLKRNHAQYLSLDINWNYYKPEQKEEYLRELEGLVKSDYSSLSDAEKKAVNLAAVYSVNPETDFKLWDQLLAKNEHLQKADWNNMTLDEKKAAYYLAWGPVPEADNSFKMAVFLRVAMIIGAAYVIYASAMAYFRSKKDLPTLTPEWKEATRKRMIENRADPYTGASAPLFTKDGIKTPEEVFGNK